MHKLAPIAVSEATLALVVNGGAAVAKHGASATSSSSTTSSSGAWPVATFPLPTSPGVVLSQSSTRATVRSTDSVYTVMQKLDALYVTQKGCRSRVLVNKPVDYLCPGGEVYFTFAALDPKPTDPSRSQTNAFRVS